MKSRWLATALSVTLWSGSAFLPLMNFVLKNLPGHFFRALYKFEVVKSLAPKKEWLAWLKLFTWKNFKI